MTRVREREYEPNAAGVKFAIDESLKLINTAVPGVVVSYDRARRRATVRSAFPTVLKNGLRVPAPEISDVPVLFQQSRNVSMVFDLIPGDDVGLMFSQRGLEHWLDAYGSADPDVSRFFAYGDAFVLPGFGLHPGDEEPWAGAPKSDAPWIVQRNTESGGFISLTDKQDGTTVVTVSGDLVVTGEITGTGGTPGGGGTDATARAGVAANATRITALEGRVEVVVHTTQAAYDAAPSDDGKLHVLALST